MKPPIQEIRENKKTNSSPTNRKQNKFSNKTPGTSKEDNSLAKQKGNACSFNFVVYEVSDHL